MEDKEYVFSVIPRNSRLLIEINQIYCTQDQADYQNKMDKEHMYIRRA